MDGLSFGDRFRDHQTSPVAEGNGIPVQYSCLRRKHRAHVGEGTISGEKTGRFSSSDRKRGVPRDGLGEQIWHYIPAVSGKVGKEDGVSH